MSKKIELLYVPTGKISSFYVIDAKEILKQPKCEYKEANGVPVPAEKKIKIEIDDSLSGYTAKELKVFAATSEIGGFKSMNKTMLLEALTKINFKPIENTEI